MKSIGILYVATGPYIVFWEQFYKSFEEHFLPGMEKHYYIFTDAESFYADDSDRVHKTFVKAEPWPLPTLLKYHRFLEKEAELRKHDYLYQANGNSCCVGDVLADDFLPREELGEKLFFTRHIGYCNSKPWEFPYERDCSSGAYIPYNCGKTYVFGAMNGGTTEAYIAMMKELDHQIVEDLKRNKIAKAHDESHVNHYFCKATNYRLLSFEYAWPGEQTPEKPVYISCVDKSQYLDVSTMKNSIEKQKFTLSGLFSRTIRKRCPVMLAARDWCLRKQV